MNLHVFDSSCPVVDSYVLQRAPLDAFPSDDGDYIDMPMLVSNTGNEASGLPFTNLLEIHHACLRSTPGYHAGHAVSVHPAKDNTEAQTPS